MILFHYRTTWSVLGEAAASSWHVIELYIQHPGYFNDEQYICDYFGIENYSYETHCKNRHSLFPN